MVSKNYSRELEGVPPPMDESWWEAVLAEDEAGRTPAHGRGQLRDPAPAQGQERDEPEPVDWDEAGQLYEHDLAVDLEVTGYNRGGLLVSGKRLQGFVPLSHLIEMPADKADPDPWLATYVGREMHLKVIECDPERGRVVFSERAALSRPGSRNQLLDQLKPGDCVVGTVTNITDFGVFVDLGGVEGLIHVSEISWGRVRHPVDVVRLNQKLDVFVINVDRERARVALSLKRMYPNPWETAEDRYYPGQVIEAVVTSLVSFGAFARLEEGLDGLIHISEICPEEPVNNPADFLQEGQRVRVRVFHVDSSKQRLGLSMRLDEVF